MAELRRFSPDDIATLKAMAQQGHDGKTIARAIARTPQAIRVKCVELGISLRRANGKNRRVQFPESTWLGLREEGARYGMKPARLAVVMIEIAIRDGLIGAILDLPPRRSPAAAAARRRIEMLATPRIASASFDDAPEAAARPEV